MSVAGSGSSATFRPHAIIVSDDPDLRTFLGEGLLMAGFWTSAVASGIQAIEVFRLRSFDLVIIDANLAGLGASELVRRLRGRQVGSAPLTDVPIVAIAPDGPARDRLAGSVTVDAVFEAPIKLDELAAALMALVREWRAAHPDRPVSDASPSQRRQGI